MKSSKSQYSSLRKTEVCTVREDRATVATRPTKLHACGCLGRRTLWMIRKVCPFVRYGHSAMATLPARP